MLKYNNRERTDHIAVHYAPEHHKTHKDQLLKLARRNGKLNLGVHFILRQNGIVERGIPLAHYADYELPHYKDSIYVMYTGDKLTHAAKFALNQISDHLNLPLKE